MNIQDLLSGRKNCVCGACHVCPIKHVVIRDGAIDDLSVLTEKDHHILLVADENTYAAAGKRVADVLGHKVYRTLIYRRTGILVPNEEAVSEMKDCLDRETDLIVGIGSGVINDLCKYVAHSVSLPYDIVATAPSMDGYASKGAAMILDGMKVTPTAAVPRSIIADLSVLATAPLSMIRAGYGDIIGKYSCLNDWRLSQIVNGEKVCEEVYRLTMEAAEETLTLAEGLLARDHRALAALMEALVGVGILMAYVGHSRPASGSEHHLSHYFEIVGIIRGENYYPHGIDVLYSAIESAHMREKLFREGDPFASVAPLDDDRYCANIRRIYGPLADEVLALQEKLGWYRVDRLPIYRERWTEIRRVLAEAPDARTMTGYAEKIGLDAEEFRRFYGDDKIADARLFAKDLKDRYTVLWLYYDLFAGGGASC